MLGMLSLLPFSASAQLLFTIEATATDSGLVYTSGNSYTFAFTLNDYSPTTPVGASTNFFHKWQEDLSEPDLFSNLSGSGLTGSYTQSFQPFHQIQVYDDSEEETPNLLLLSFSSLDNTSGLTFDGIGTGLSILSFEATYTGLSFDVASGNTLPNPYDYFSSYIGTYTAASTESSTYIADYPSDTRVYFTVDSLTISSVSAVPEPSTYAAILGVLALGLTGWRRHRQIKA